MLQVLQAANWRESAGPHGEWTELLKRATVARCQLPGQAEVGDRDRTNLVPVRNEVGTRPGPSGFPSLLRGVVFVSDPIACDSRSYCSMSQHVLSLS